MSILGWLVLGLLAGAVARVVLPGRQPIGCLGTIAVGVLGALVGGALASAAGLGEIGDFYDLETWGISIAGAILLLLVLGALAGRRRRPPVARDRDRR